MKWFLPLLAILVSHSAWAQGPLPLWTFQVRDSLVHPTQRFTQGLLWDNGQLIESTGLNGQSAVYRMDERGNLLQQQGLSARHFGEGIARAGDHYVWLTWTSGVAFLLDAHSLAFVDSFPIAGEGWGMAMCEEGLFMSNGSADLLELSLADRRIVGRQKVRAQGVPISRLNELECVGPYMLANIWGSDSVAVIRRQTAAVEAWIDLSGLARRARSRHRPSEVTNGLAWDGSRLWITGKLWPWIWALEIPELSAEKSIAVPPPGTSPR